MKQSLLIIFISISFISFSQVPKSGTYIYKYCDLEYNICYSTCKVVIKGSYITVYATRELARNRTFTKEGDIISKGIILKHKTGKWIIAKTQKDKNANEIGINGPPILDFKKREYWQF